MRLDRLTQLADFLETTVKPGWLNMKIWADDGFAEQKCGTTACAFGWATQCFPELEINRDEHGLVNEWGVRIVGTESYGFDAAEEFFELSERDVMRLFCPDFYSRDEQTDAAAVIQRIRDLVSKHR